MEVASRPRFAAGVALVGAGIVVASTVSPVSDLHLPDIHVPALRTAEVDLAAAVNPIEVYAQVIQNALAGASTLAKDAKPGEVIKQVLANQLSNVTTAGGDLADVLKTQVPQLVQTVVTQLGAGNVEGATNTLLQIPLAVALPVLPTLLVNPLQNVANVINAFTTDTLGTELIITGLLAPLINTPAAEATAMQNVMDAVATGNPAAVLGAMLTAPATVLDGMLNGGYGPDLGPLTGQQGIIVKAGGLFSPTALTLGPNGIVVNTGGPIAALQAILNKITAAITPQKAAQPAVKPASSDVASLPAAGATTVTLKTGSTASIPAKASTSAAAATDDKATETSAQQPDNAADDTADTTKDSSSASAGTPASSSDAAESGSTTKDSTPEADSTDAKDVKKPTDPSTGNKSEPGNSAGSDAGKSGDASNSTVGHETTKGQHTGTTKSTSDGAAKGASKEAHTASHGRHAK